MARETPLGRVETNLIVQRRSADPACLEADSELYALGRLQAHERVREASIELAIPLHVAAEPHGKTCGNDLDDAAEGVAGLFARIDLFDNRALGGRVGNAHL